MKYCPACQTRYDEEILRFCTKDGTPLIDENQPNFTELPSVSADEYGEETVIRRKTPAPKPPPLDPDSDEYQTRIERTDSAQRIVIPMAEEEEKPEQQIRTKTTPSPRMPPPRESNTAIVVLLTIIGTVVATTAIIGIFWVLSNQGASEANQNVNSNFNSLNSNLNDNMNADNSLFDSNFNANVNTNTNSNVNTNTNANTRTPTPTPSPSPSPSPTPDDDDNSNTNVNTNTSTPTPRPTLTPRASPSPTKPPANSPGNTPPVNAGLLNARAVNLRTPSYPPIARETRASGRVQVQVMLDENGNVNSAKAVSGNPLLRSSAENAARNSKFDPVRVGGKTVRATGFVVYNFVGQN